MRRQSTVAVWFVLALLSIVPSAFSQDADSWTGKRVMVIRWNAELKAGTKVVAQARLGSLLTVAQTKGEWLWIKQAGGWIKRNNVVLYDRAIDHFTAAIRRSPTIDAYHQRGVAFATLKQYEKAIADFDAVIERDANNVAAYNDRGNALRKLGESDRAIADFSKVIDSKVRHPAVYTNRGLTWHDKGDYDRALADYNTAVQLDAKFAPAWEAAGSTRQAKGDFANAAVNFKKALKLDPKFDRAHNNLAWLLATNPGEQLRDGKQAVEHALQACELQKFQDAGYLDTLAAAYAEAGQFGDAIKRAKEAIEQASESDKENIAARLRLYEAGQPFRESSD